MTDRSQSPTFTSSTDPARGGKTSLPVCPWNHNPDCINTHTHILHLRREWQSGGVSAKGTKSLLMEEKKNLYSQPPLFTVSAIQNQKTLTDWHTSRDPQLNLFKCIKKQQQFSE